jgi:ATP-dependent DNA ligase
LKLSKESPATFIVFDLLVDEKGKSLVNLRLQARREQLERLAKKYFSKNKSIRLSPVAKDVSVARKWFHMGVGLDGVVAKRRNLPYQGGQRTGMQKIKKQRTADCVVGKDSATWKTAPWWDRCFSVFTTMKGGSTTLDSLPPSGMRIAGQSPKDSKI